MQVLTSTHGIGAEQTGGEIERRLLLNGVFDHPLVSGYRDLCRIETQNHRVLRETLDQFQPDLVHVWSLDGLSKSLVFALRSLRLAVVYDVADPWIAVGIRADPWLRWWNRPRIPFFSQLWRATLELCGHRKRLDPLALTRPMKGYDRLPDVYGELSAQMEPGSIGAFRFDRIYFCSQTLRDETERAGFRVSHAEIIPHGIPTERYVGEVKPPTVPCNKLLVVARLQKRSGVLTAVNALRIARQNHSQATLSIYGRGDTAFMAELRSLIATHHVPVEFLAVSDLVRDLPAVYRRHDALLHTSEWNEPFSRTILEALASGLPVVGSAAGAAGELLRHGENALTFAPGNAEELALRIQELQTNAALRCRIAEAGQSEVLSRFNETSVTDQIENYLETSCQIWRDASG